LTVPVEAIIEKNGKKYVMVQNTQKSSSSTSSNNKRASNSEFPGKLVEVKTGLKNKTLVEIISGVTEGETVMTELSNSTNMNTNSNKNRTTQGSVSGMRSGGMGSASGK
jgi:HlyD family secretion protein